MWRILAIAGSFVFAVLVTSGITMIADYPEAVAAPAVAMTCLITGAVAVWMSIQWFNRRDDPRHSIRPPDAP